MALALFDLDHTLLAGDSGIMWQHYLGRLGVMGDEKSHLTRAQRFSDDYHQGVLNYSSFLDFMLDPLVRFPLSDLLAWREDFINQKIKPVVKAQGLEVIQAHRDRGDCPVMISATNRFITEPIAQVFGIEHVICTDPEVVEGRYTGKIIGDPCYQEGKILRLVQWVSQHGLSLSAATFYSDSYNDLALLSYVDHPVAVDPDVRLREFASLQGWEILELK
ncbi:MAG: HAD-IB family hydrolase [Candidatus Pseudomonas phytovorans]|uniref:Histidinol-phosphatase n=1 Tax=Candidatus Pseudomonas phytovorans TaxID=3121377 RepID=A0AAJ5WKI5_9PSED|nr:HAD family hydrolase [Pseudomonas sp.]WEK32754.1 MAG: HAD-IB family hydrolase [Pseudomonas sp.]